MSAVSGPCPKPLTSQQGWKRIADGFFNELNLANCLGALDDKDIGIECPGCSGSEYYN